MEPKTEVRLLYLMEDCLCEIEISDFLSKFIDQIQTPEVLNSVFKSTIDATDDLKIPMVIYGIGRIESSRCSRLQLALAILMKGRFSWIGNIEVFDPIINENESRVMQTLGCSVLSVNEQCRREALKPTIFFMPHCDLRLYNNLLEANWAEDKLKNIILLGNKSKDYEMFSQLAKSVGDTKKPDIYLRSRMRFAQNFSKEFNVEIVKENIDNYFHGAFVGLSWYSYNVIDYVETETPSTCSEYNIPWPSKNY